MPDKKRFLKNLDINFISLVDKAANQKVVIFKSADPSKNSYNKVVNILKVDEDKREVTGVVYEPDVADTEGDYTTADEIKKAAYLFMKNRKTTNIDKQHDETPDEGFVAESWIVQKNDARLPDAIEGSWAVVIKVENDETWKGVKSGEITGLSMGGVAVAEQVQKNNSDEPSWLHKVMKSIKDGFEKISVSKDFKSTWNQDQLRRMTWALSDSISEILNDDEIEDKKTKIVADLEQFKAAVENFDFSSTEEVSKNKKKDGTDMTPEQVAQIVKDTVTPVLESAMETVNENINKMKTDFNDKAGKFEERLDVVEKSSPGSAQEGVEFFKSDEGYKGPGWLS